MFRFIKNMFNGLLSFSGSLASMTNVSIFTKCTFVNNQPCMTRPALIDLNLDEYNQGSHYYLFIVNLDRYNRSCNTLDINLVDYVFQTKKKM